MKKIFLKHKGMSIYTTFKNDDPKNNDPNVYHFSLAEFGSEHHEEFSFDVRDLRTWTPESHPAFLSTDDTPDARSRNTRKRKLAWDAYFKSNNRELHIRKVIRNAIRQGFLGIE